uniref:AAA+ ATPase domain-containing protein n=1 Tax=viral metagenome TaxID=1070528 RepID=A0A6C0DNI9_9ZZZZ
MFYSGDIESQLKMVSGNILNMIIFDKFKTGTPFIDAFVTTMLLTGVTYIYQYINTYFFKLVNTIQNINYDFDSWFSRKNIVEYEGKIALSTGFYDGCLNQSNTFSDRFKALWNFIIKNISDNESINHIKEYSFNNKTNNNERDLGTYMVVQSEKFLISKEYGIYAYTTIHGEETDEDDTSKNKIEKKKNRMEKIVIKLFSYKSDTNTIKDFVEKITKEYIASIEVLRDNKRFIYTLSNTKYEDDHYEMWNETLFSSTRKFNNLFFKDKANIMKKLDFFINNKEWYYDKGIPYSIGIGMHGPPGTGKTSLIKAIANYTNRHVIVISLKLIKTKKELDSIFFEERYSRDNKKCSVSFDKKIIVFEDIDCVGDIVLDREKNKNKNITGLGKKLDFGELSSTSKINLGDLLETMAATEKETDKKFVLPKMPNDDEPITLDDILNLWDGIRETPGRIMIISSNHYHDLDPALIRPGRIDITLELSYASHETMKEIYRHLFDETINNNMLEEIKEDFYTPAEIINIYMNEEQDKTRFLERLRKNEHV